MSTFLRVKNDDKQEIISFLADYVGRSSEVTYIVNQLMTKASIQVDILGQHLKTLNN